MFRSVTEMVCENKSNRSLGLKDIHADFSVLHCYVYLVIILASHFPFVVLICLVILIHVLIKTAIECFSLPILFLA